MNRAVSRQRMWQKARVAEGRCSTCGAKRPRDLKILCRTCQDKANLLHMKLYYRHLGRESAWDPGRIQPGPKRRAA